MIIPYGLGKDVSIAFGQVYITVGVSLSPAPCFLLLGMLLRQICLGYCTSDDYPTCCPWKFLGPHNY